MFIKMWRLKFICFYLLVSLNVQGAESSGNTDLVALQKQQLELILVDMNQTGAAIYDTFTTDPQGVVESGCLDDLRQIDIDAITIDPTNILAAVYATLKDEIRTMGCNAANEKMNEITAKLEQNLELPHGLGTIDISQGAGIGDGSDGLSDVNVELDSDKVAADITSETLGDVRVSPYKVSQNLSAIEEVSKDKNSNPLNSKGLEKTLEDVIDIDSFWGEKEKDEDKPL